MLSRCSSPTELAIRLLSPNRLEADAEALDTYKEELDLSHSLAKTAEVDPSFLRLYHGSEEVFTIWQQSLSPQYYETALKERIELAIGFSTHSINRPALFRRALTRDHIPRPAVGMRNFLGQTLLHAVALRIGKCAQYIFGDPQRESKEEEEDLAGKSGQADVREVLALLIIDQGWRSILREIIREGADLHSTDWRSHTPFTNLLRGISGLSPEVAVKIWLTDLRDCGVDLYEYGRREEELWGGSRTWKLVSFTYGSSPSDWHVEWEWRPKECEEQCEQVQEIPGSWVED